MLQRTNYYTLLLFIVFAWHQSLYAHGHTMKLFATAEGDKISGYVYFPGGKRAQNVEVNIQSPSMNTLDQVTTNSQGEFIYPVSYRTDYILTVYTADGHLAKQTIKADELNENLPTLSLKTAQQKEKSAELPTPPEKSIEVVNKMALSPEELASLLEKTVSHQLRPVHERLEQYEAKIRLHDILGGIGYIFGIMGLIFYFGQRKK